MQCSKEFTLTVNDGFDCGGTPSSIASMVWTVGLCNTDGSASGTAAGAAGTFSVSGTADGSSVYGFYGNFCNPTDDDITIQFAFSVFYNITGGGSVFLASRPVTEPDPGDPNCSILGADTVFFSNLGGAGVANPSSNVTIPAASNIRIAFIMVGAAFFVGGYFANGTWTASVV